MLDVAYGEKHIMEGRDTAVPDDAKVYTFVTAGLTLSSTTCFRYFILFSLETVLLKVSLTGC